MPGNTGQPFNITAHHGGFCRHGRHHFQFLQLSPCLIFGIFRHLRFFNLFAQRLKLVRCIIQFTQFFLNGFHLFIQIILALAFFHLLFHAGTNFLFDLQQINFAFHQRHQVLKTLVHAFHFQYLLLLSQFKRHVSSHGIGETGSVINAVKRG